MALDALKVLLIEDNPGDARLIREMLTPAFSGRFELESVERLSDGLERLASNSFGVVLLDLSLNETQGIETFRAVHDRVPGVPVVVLTGLNDDALAAEALQAGAQDYLVKGQVDRHLLARSLQYAVERGRIEEQLRQRVNELAEAGKRKDEFLAILSHELRNPLSPLMMGVQLLRQRQSPDDERRWAEAMIERQIRTLVRLVDDLLDVSRISQGKVALRKEPMDISAAIGRAVEATRPLFEQQHHQLEVSLPPQPIQIEGDSIRIEQIMVNLLTNGAKYTNPHGRVWVSATVENQDAVIRVRDTGVGISPEMLERIFELFTQADQASDRPLQWGMGVGLSLVRSFVKLHGGTVKAMSAGPGAGSEFQINLPLLQNAQQGTDPSREPAPTGSSVTDRPCKVLLAEDHADSADCIAKMLQLWGHEVRVVGDGPAALAAAEEFVPDVMLLDIGLPGMNGYEVAKKLRGQAALNEMLIVALTGFGREEDRERAFSAGFNCHVTKPIEPEALRKLLSQVCRTQHAEV